MSKFNNSQPLTSCAGTTNKALQNKVICVDGKKKFCIFTTSHSRW